jgi:hypothetical protein
MKTIPEKFTRDYESDGVNRKIQEAYEQILNPMLDEGAAEDAAKTLDAIIASSGDEIKKVAQSMKKSYQKNGGFSRKQAQWIYNTWQAIKK